METGRDKVGLFGGSFDPIHFGHLKMAKDLLEMEDLKQMWFCPAKINPHKQDRSPAPIEHRLKMVSLAIEGSSHFSLIDNEAKRGGVSYTIDTIKELLEKERLLAMPKEIYLVMSEEVLPNFFRWKSAEEIVSLVPLLIGSRFSPGEKVLHFEATPSILEAIKKGQRLTDPFEISSTEIRERIKKGMDCKEFLPKKVLDYIYQNNLYC